MSDGYGKIILLLGILVVGIVVLLFALRTLFGINLMDRHNSMDRLIVTGIVLVSLYSGMKIIASGKINKLGHSVDDNKYMQTSGGLNRLKKIERQMST